LHHNRLFTKAQHYAPYFKLQLQTELVTTTKESALFFSLLLFEEPDGVMLFFLSSAIVQEEVAVQSGMFVRTSGSRTVVTSPPAILFSIPEGTNIEIKFQA
jgi:hypothetical protein